MISASTRATLLKLHRWVGLTVAALLLVQGTTGSLLLDSFSSSIAEGRRRAIQSGEMPAEIDAAVLSQALVGMLSRVLLWWIDDPQPVARETVIETLTRIQLSGTHPA